MRSIVRTTRVAIALVTVLVGLNLGDSRGAAASVHPPVAAPPSQAFGNFPLTFVENRGQTDSRVRYYAQGPRFAVYLTRRDIVLTFLKDAKVPTGDGHVLALRFVGANPAVAVDADRAQGIVSYLRGSEPSK